MSMHQEPPFYRFVTDQSAMNAIASELSEEPALGVDLEADSMYHYQEKVCLLQISSASANVLVDTLEVRNLSSLAKVFENPGIRKIFHGADYDIRSLHRDFNFKVRSLFDTQIAARFLGLKETSLADLLKVKLGIRIKKKYQKEDWSRRPLPEAMLDYAVMDSCHLIALADLLQKELVERGRLSWAEEECDVQSRVRSLNNHEGPLFLKFKGAGKYDARSLAVLEAILAFREKVAKERNRPPFKVLGNAFIMELVKEKPVTRKELECLKGASERQKKALGDGLLRNIGKAMRLPEDKLPEYPRKKRQSFRPDISKRVKALKDWREHCARAWGMDPGVICNNALIQSIAAANPRDLDSLGQIDEMRDWQREAYGREICTLLEKRGPAG